ncbi:oxidoreductase, molybdopterin binding protein [Candidatus Koribacter versatilis Ellin345]|uniref:Oxidoreductase, molybdopterin binding protein n=1 Tax=Koribacter versatilis (strain Ellin345) TaxID=204669 RepID=Q1IJK7_KORVE|nr:molybdopterin-dependent oxidoreductase [Candidatus Koribacter versatilis]ABF42943.1 oxidoreductase, molybdopterin binding protein [Candidatus Koribacter versatilis Ellin345]
MSKISRRGFITTGIAAAASLSGVAVAAKLAGKYGLVPPDHGGLYGPGETLTYAAQRLLTRHSVAREFDRSQISAKPLANEITPLPAEFKRHEAAGFTDWRLMVEGMAAMPTSFSVDELKSFPSHSHITEIACEEGWSYVAEWKGVPLSYILDRVGALPQTRYVVYQSIQMPDWWDSLDMADALHPQTLIATHINGADLPVGFGGPLRMRVPRQLGYKNIKFINKLILTDNIKRFGKGLGSSSPEAGYAWYAGI